MTMLLHLLTAAALGAPQATQWQRLAALSPDGGTRAAFSAAAGHAAAAAPPLAEADDPRCRFPARTNLLAASGGGAAASLAPCAALAEWKADLHASGVAMIFAAQFGGNPASYMGHIFLKVLSEDPGPMGRGPLDLMDKTIGFVALVPDGISPGEYALRGLAGGFEGGFVVNSFYELAFQYQALESRDLWEYRLLLTPAEIDLLLDLVWELSHSAHFDYRFLSANCAAMLGAMLAVVRPDISETPGRYLYTTPHDVMKWLTTHGLLGERRGWPSARAELNQRLRQLSPAEQELLARDAEQGSVARGQRFAYYDALVAWLDFAELKAHKAPLEVQVSHRRAALRALARAPLPAAPAAPTPLTSTDPTLGHPVAMGLTGVGRRGTATLLDLEIRPAGHELLDPPAGFSDSMAIAFFDAHARYDAEERALRLRSFDLMRLRTVAPFSWRDKTFAWAFRFGSEDPGLARFPNGYAVVAGGVGIAVAPTPGWRAWLVPGGVARVGFAPHATADAGPGGEAGMLLTLASALRVEALASELIPYDHAYGRSVPETEASVTAAVSLTPAADLHLQVVRRSEPTGTEVSVQLLRFF